uniref:Uncharacterized protein n=1 Tax=Rhizophora mucronata TaxID=61149 RepID=A0A2P2QLF3_RHIMU
MPILCRPHFAAGLLPVAFFLGSRGFCSAFMGIEDGLEARALGAVSLGLGFFFLTGVGAGCIPACFAACRDAIFTSKSILQRMPS